MRTENVEEEVRIWLSRRLVGEIIRMSDVRILELFKRHMGLLTTMYGSEGHYHRMLDFHGLWDSPEYVREFTRGVVPHDAEEWAQRYQNYDIYPADLERIVEFLNHADHNPCTIIDPILMNEFMSKVTAGLIRIMLWTGTKKFMSFYPAMKEKFIFSTFGAGHLSAMGLERAVHDERTRRQENLSPLWNNPSSDP